MKRLILPFLLFIAFSSSAQIVNIPDPVFKQSLFDNGIDANFDGEIQLSEALNTYTLQVLGGSGNIVDFTGLQAFTNLTYLKIWSNYAPVLDLTGLSQLRDLDFEGQNLTSVILDGCIGLESVFCNANPLLLNLDLSGKTNLQELEMQNSGDINVNVQGCTNLQRIELSWGQISSIDASNLPSLKSLVSIMSFYLDSINVSNCPNLTKVEIWDDMAASYFNFEGSNNIDTLFLPKLAFPSLDLSNLTNLSSLDGDLGLNITHLNLKNGRNTAINPDFAAGMYSLEYLCADDFEILYLQGIFTSAYVPLNINSFCSFLPGGHYNSIQGNVTADLDNNGCGAGDPGVQNLPVKIDDNLGSIFFTHTNSSGFYSVYTNSGNFNVSPVFSHPYFTLSAASGNVVFDTLNSLIDTVDFCITPNGLHNDLEVTLIPMGNARPGFPVHYVLSYKNYGTTTLTGNLQLNYDNSKMTFDNATPVVSLQSAGQLNWNYSNLAPFQSGTVNLTFTLLPPPVNNVGDSISFLAAINPTANDETPDNNSFTLLQEIRGSFDPNDKACLEGGKLDIADIGKDLHYVIRFQNLGNDTAFNIVIADTLSDKLDWNTVEFINSSHPCLVKQTNNKLEFYFQDIKLPWAAANEPESHGYIVFKVKTKSTLVIGDSINNIASIYFDFNLPVVTNVATTIVIPTSPVPVKLDYFSVGKKNETNLLTWKALSTHGNTSFNIERSSDGIHFNKIGNITASMQRCQLPFDFTDDKPITGKNYYRLKITDADGVSFYSKTLVIGNIKDDIEILAISNGPGNIIVYFNSTKQQTVQLKILAADGKTIYKSSSIIPAGNGQLNLGIKSLSHGIYTLMVNTTKGNTATKRFVK